MAMLREVYLDDNRDTKAQGSRETATGNALSELPRR